MKTKNATLTSQKYWEKVWISTECPSMSYPEIISIRNHGKNEFHRFFSKHLADIPSGASIIEFGCAQSTWLPYFARMHGLEVAGLDYSTLGCERARAILARENIDGLIIERDLFLPPSKDDLLFNVGISFGVIEHFEDPSIPLKAMSRYLKPGGLLLTIVPNMTGIVGSFQKYLNQSIYEIHQLVDAASMSNYHSIAGFDPLAVEYLLPFGLTVANPGSKMQLFNKFLFQLAKIITVTFWGIDRITCRALPRTKYFSPYVICIAKKNASQKN